MIKKRYTAILIILSVIFSLLVLVVPFLTKYLIDEAINLSNNGGSYDKLIMYIIIISIFTLLAIIVKIIDNILFSRFYINLENKLRNDLFSSMTYKSLSSLLDFKAGDIEVLYSQDIRNVIRSKLQIIPSFVKQLVRAIASIILLFILDETKYKIIILILLGIGIVALISARIYSKLIKPHHKKVLEADSQASSFFIESFNHHKQIISYDAYNRSIDYYIKLNDISRDEKRKRNRIVYSANSFVYAFITIIYSICIILGAIFIARGIYTYGSLIAIVQLINNVEAPFLSLSSLINNYNLGLTSEERLKKLMNLEEEDKNQEIDDFDSIKITNLSFSYDNERMVINGLNLCINKGEILKIAGESGIGKTTLLMLLLGFLKPTSGNIKFIKDNKEYDTFKSRLLFSYLSQENILFSASIRENIYILTGVNDIDKINNALKMANIYDEIYVLKDGLDTKLNNNTGLSLGQIQRILIAILILYDKPILLLDEFSSSLDKDNENKIIDNLLSLNKTIIYITHRNNEIENQKIINIKHNEE